MSPSDTVWEFAPSASINQLDIVPPPPGVAQVPSPFKNLTLSVPPEASGTIPILALPPNCIGCKVFADVEESITKLVFIPPAFVPAAAIDIDNTPEPVPSISTHAVPFQKYIKFVAVL